MPAGLAAVRGVPGVDLNPDAPSIFRFGAQNRDELAPAGVTDASGQPGLRPGAVGQILAGIVGVGHGFGPPQHVGDLQVLHHQQVVARDEGGPVCGESPCAGWRSCDAGPRRFPACGRGSSTAVERGPTAAAPRPAYRGGTSPARIVDMLTVAGGGETDNPDIDPAWRPVAGSGLVGTSSHESTSIQRRPWRLIWIVFTRPCTWRYPANLDLPDTLQIRPPVLGQPARAVAVLGPLHTVETRRALKTRIGQLSGRRLTRRKNPANAIFSRRSVACWDSKTTRVLDPDAPTGSRSAVRTDPHSSSGSYCATRHPDVPAVQRYRVPGAPPHMPATRRAGAPSDAAEIHKTVSWLHHRVPLVLDYDLPAALGGDLPQQLAQWASGPPASGVDMSGTTPGAGPASTPRQKCGLTCARTCQQRYEAEPTNSRPPLVAAVIGHHQSHCPWAPNIPAFGAL